MGQTRHRGGLDPFWDLVATARRLQAPGGCPWDRAQTVRSLTPHLIEETWEVDVGTARGAGAAQARGQGSANLSQWQASAKLSPSAKPSTNCGALG